MFVSPRKQHHFPKTQTSSFVQTLKQVSTRSSRQGITIGKYKAKAIQEDLGIFTYISAYSDISMHIQSDIVKHI